ncbi:MAG: hypothetical protein IRZ32_08290 [Solirubrobacteraceae bacterium]|nr:hypothetical protein [Solirubrobacteraceae bacterium]
MPFVLSELPPAWVATDRPCYVAESPVVVRGGGFDPGQPLRITREGEVVATAVAEPDGTFAAAVDAGPLPDGVAERVVELAVTGTTTSVARRVRVTRFGATWAPRAAHPRARVRFSAWGFGPGVAVYVHYVRPGGGAVATVRLGETRGECGTIRRTAPRRLFPLRPAAGTWRLQFDTSRAYDPQAVPRVVLPVRVGRPAVR